MEMSQIKMLFGIENIPKNICLECKIRLVSEECDNCDMPLCLNCKSKHWCNQ